MKPPVFQPGKHWYWLLASACMGALFLYRFLLASRNLPTIGAEDYGMLALSSHPDSLALLWADLRQSVYRPLIYSLYFLVERSHRWFGEGGVWWFVSFLLLCQLLFFATAFSRLLNSRFAAAFALLFTLLGSLPFRFSQFWMGYALIYCAFNTAVLLALLAARCGKDRYLLPAWLIAVYSTTVGLVPVFLLNSFAFFRKKRVRTSLLYLVLAAPLVAALAWKAFFFRPGAVWYEPVFHQYAGRIDLAYQWSHTAAYLSLLLGSLHGGAQSLSAWVLWPLWGVELGAVLGALLLKGDAPTRGLLLRCLCATAALLLAFSFLPNQEARHSLFLLPLWIFSLALSLDRWLALRPTAGRVLLALFFLPLAVSAASIAGKGWHERNRGITEMRSVARTVAAAAHQKVMELPEEGPFCLAEAEAVEIPFSLPRRFPKDVYLKDAARSGSLLAWSRRGISPREVLRLPCRFSLGTAHSFPSDF